MKGVWKLLIVGFWKSDRLYAHDECDCAKNKDRENGVDSAEVADIWGRHRAQPSHGAREGKGDGPDHCGEELIGVGVDDAPAHLAHVLPRHGQHNDGPLVGEPSQGNDSRGHAQQTPDDVVSGQIGSAAKPETELVMMIVNKNVQS